MRQYVLHYCDCESLIKHSLKEGSHLLQDKRFVGYLRVLEKALERGTTNALVAARVLRRHENSCA